MSSPDARQGDSVSLKPPSPDPSLFPSDSCRGASANPRRGPCCRDSTVGHPGPSATSGSPQTARVRASASPSLSTERSPRQSICASRDRRGALSREAILCCHREPRPWRLRSPLLRTPEQRGLAIAFQLAFDGGGPLYFQPGTRDGVDRWRTRSAPHVPPSVSPRSSTNLVPSEFGPTDALTAPLARRQQARTDHCLPCKSTLLLQ